LERTWRKAGEPGENLKRTWRDHGENQERTLRQPEENLE